MQLITYFAPKGGTGRTTAMMATASSLVSAGHSVAVLDLTEQARPGWTFGASFISQWEDRMVETGADADQFVTAPAFDDKTAEEALDRFFREGFDYVLVDTARHPDSATAWIMNQSDLVIVPMRSPHDAAWSSQWLSANRHPKKRTYGLVMDPMTQDDFVLIHAVFTGAPMLNTWLQHLATLGGQFSAGSLHVKPGFDAVCPGGTYDEELILRLDRVSALHAADALCNEIKQLLECQNPSKYSVNIPRAKGGTFAHLQAVLLQPGFA